MYRSGERGKEEHPTALLVETTSGPKPGRAIDLACGTGRNAMYLAQQGWSVTAVDGSDTAVATLKRRAAELGLEINAQTADLTAPSFALPQSAFELVTIAFYWQPELFPIAKESVAPGGVLLAIAHTAEPGEGTSRKRAQAGELAAMFKDWNLLWTYEGASRDPAHRRPVAEIVARRPL